MLLSARKRSGMEAGCNGRIVVEHAALSGCVPIPKRRSVHALGTSIQGAQPQGAASRRYSAPQAVGLMGRSERNRALTLASQRQPDLSRVSATNTAKQQKRLAHDTGAVEIERGWK